MVRFVPTDSIDQIAPDVFWSTGSAGAYINDAYNPIIAGGPSQNGMSEEELSALNTTAIDTTAANYENAARATANSLAGRGGDSGLQSGIDTGIKANVASQAAGTLSSEELGIANENAQLGRQQYWQAIGGKQALAGMENPESYASLASSSNQSAFGEADTIQQQKSQEIGDIVGGAVGIGSAIFSGGMSTLANPNSFGNMYKSGALGPSSSWGQNQPGNFVSPTFTPQSTAIPDI